MDFTDEQIKVMLGLLENKDQNIDDQQWKEKLQKSKNGRNLSNAHNLLLILQNDESLKGKFAYNLLTHKIEIVGEVPWKRNLASYEMTDYDDSCLRNYLSMNYDIKGKDLVYDCVNQIVMEQSYHPIREYLDSVRGTWDGVPRLDNLLIDFFEADDSLLTRCQTRLPFVAAVARAFQPGCKWDYVLTLKGDQGLGKSSFFQQITPKPEWFTDSLDDMRG